MPTVEHIHIFETSTKATTDWVLRLSAIILRIIAVVSKHWLLFINMALTIEAILPIMAPILAASNHVSVARFIYTLYSPFCHQLPERSFFLFGPQATYTLHELEALIGSDVPLRYIGNPAIGYKMAVCQRDIATYLALLAASLAFIPLRRRLRPIPIKVFLLLCLPMVIDGLGQLFMLWESTPGSRVFSGAVFGIACIWLSYPYIEVGMQDVARTVRKIGSDSLKVQKDNTTRDANSQ